MITYRHDGLQPFKITVKNDGKIVGRILRNALGAYYYQPKHSPLRGEPFSTIDAVKRSLEGREL